MKKIVALSTVLVMVVSLVGPSTAGAETADDLQQQITDLQDQLDALLAQLGELEGEETGAGACPSACAAVSSFNRNLSQGMTGDDVKCLQAMLNQDAATKVASSGAGSPGSETTYYGPLTKAAVVKFQEKYASEVLASWGLTAGTGFFGSTSRAKMNALLAACGEEELTCPDYTTETSCEDADCYWYDDACHEESEAEATCPDYTAETECETADCYWYSDACHAEEEEVGEAELEVSLADNTPASAVIPDDSMATFVKFDFTNNGTADAEITSLKVKRFGAGASTDFTNVYLFDGDIRLTSGRSVSSSDSYVEFNNVNVTVPKGEVKTLSVKCDGAASQTGTNGFQIVEASHVDASVEVGGSYPLKGNLMTYSNVTLGVLTAGSDGTAANPTIGQTGAPVEKFSLASANENIDVHRVALEQTGTADLTYLTNWEMYQAGTKVATGTVKGDLITFVFDSPYAISNGLTKVFEVRTDIGGRTDPNDTIDLEVEEAIDVYGVGQTYGYGVSVTDSQSGDAVTCQGGTITFADTGPNAQDVKINGQDVVFLSFTLSAAIDATIKDLDVVVDDVGGSDSPSELSDVRIRNADTLATISGPVEPSSTTAGASEKLDFSNDFDIDDGETLNLEITADIDSTVTSGNDFKICLAMSSGTVCGATAVAPVIKDSENNTISDIVPSTNLTGELMNPVSSYLSVGLAASPSHSINVQNSTGVKAIGVVMTASEASAVEVSDVVVTFTPSSGNPEDIIAAVYLEDADGNMLSSTKKTIAATGETATFSGLSISIPAGGTETVYVMADIGSVSADIAFKANITGASGVTTQITGYDEDGSSVTVYDEDGSATSGDWSADANLNDGTPNALATTDAADVEVNIITAGRLVIESHSPNTTAKIMVGKTGASLEEMGMIDFVSEYEAMDVETLTFVTTSGSGDNFSSVAVQYPDEDGNTVSQTGSFIGNSVTFAGMTMYVPANETVTITLKGAAKSPANTGVSSADTMDIDWDYDVTGPSYLKVVSSSGTVDSIATDTSGLITSTSDSLVAHSSNITSSDHKLYATKPTLSLNSASPSGTHTQSSTDGVFVFNVTADSGNKLKIRQGSQNACDATTNWGTSADQVIATSSTAVENSLSILFDENAGAVTDDSVWYGGVTAALSTDLSGYTGVTFWLRSSVASTDNADFEFCYVQADANGTVTSAELSAGTCQNIGKTVAASTWVFVDLTLSGTRTDVDAYGINLADTDDIVSAVDIFVDDIRFYKEKVDINFSSDASMSTSGNASAAYLMQGVSTVAAGYINVTSTSAASVTFVPVGSYGNINVDAGTTQAFTALINSNSVINQVGTESDILTPSLTYGTASSAGDLYWYDGYATATWNDTPGLALTGNSLTY